MQLGLTHNINWDLVIEYQFGNIDITANVSGGILYTSADARIEVGCMAIILHQCIQCIQLTAACAGNGIVLTMHYAGGGITATLCNPVSRKCNTADTVNYH